MTKKRTKKRTKLGDSPSIIIGDEIASLLVMSDWFEEHGMEVAARGLRQQAEELDGRTRKVVISTTHAGFYLSAAAFRRLIELRDLRSGRSDNYPDRCLDRDDPDLITVVEELGDEAAGHPNVKLEIIEIPFHCRFQIEEDDGLEWICDSDNRWWSANCDFTGLSYISLPTS